MSILRGVLLISFRFSPCQKRCKLVPHVPVICKKRPWGPGAVAPAGACCALSGRTWALESLLGSAKGCCSIGMADDAASWTLAHRASSRIVDRIFVQTARTPNGCSKWPQRINRTSRRGNWKFGGKEPNLITDSRHVTVQRKRPARNRQSASAGLLSQPGQDLRSPETGRNRLCRVDQSHQMVHFGYDYSKSVENERMRE